MTSYLASKKLWVIAAVVSVLGLSAIGGLPSDAASPLAANHIELETAIPNRGCLQNVRTIHGNRDSTMGPCSNDALTGHREGMIISAEGRCLDANGDQAYAAYWSADCDPNNPNQEWTFESKGNGSVHFIRSGVSGKCLDASGGETGKRPYTRTCDERNLNHLWKVRGLHSRPMQPIDTGLVVPPQPVPPQPYTP